jgi:hypothetical protein
MQEKEDLQNNQPSACKAQYLACEHPHQTKQQRKKQHPEQQAKE